MKFTLAFGHFRVQIYTSEKEITQFIFDKIARQFKGKRIVCSRNGAETTG